MSETYGKLAPVLAVLAGVFWGSEGSFVRILMRDYGMDNITIMETRVMAAALMMLAFILLRNPALLRFRKRDALLFLLIGFCGSVGLNYCYNAAIDLLSLALSAVLLDLCPLYTLVIACFAFREKITGRKVFSLVLAILGCILVSGFGFEEGAMSITFAGLVFGLASGLFNALNGIFSKQLTGKGYDPWTLTFYSMAIASLMCLLPADWHMAAEVFCADGGRGAAVLLLNSLVGAMLPFLFFSMALVHMDAGKASILSTVEPAAAMVLGFLLFGETPTSLMMLGMAIVIAALILLNLPTKEAFVDEKD